MKNIKINNGRERLREGRRWRKNIQCGLGMCIKITLNWWLWNWNVCLTYRSLMCVLLVCQKLSSMGWFSDPGTFHLWLHRPLVPDRKEKVEKTNSLLSCITSKAAHITSTYLPWVRAYIWASYSWFYFRWKRDGEMESQPSQLLPADPRSRNPWWNS